MAIVWEVREAVIVQKNSPVSKLWVIDSFQPTRREAERRAEFIRTTWGAETQVRRRDIMTGKKELHSFLNLVLLNGGDRFHARLSKVYDFVSALQSEGGVES